MLFADLINASQIHTVYVVLGIDTEFTDSPYRLSEFRNPLLTLWGDHEVLSVAPGPGCLYIKIADKPFRDIRLHRLMENMFEVTQEAICLDAMKKLILPENSRDLFDACFEISCKAESSPPPDFENDYLSSIAAFADAELLERFGVMN